MIIAEVVCLVADGFVCCTQTGGAIKTTAFIHDTMAFSSSVC